MKVGIIGGGAAGFFAALSVKDHHPDAEVMILEKTSKLLSKVKVSGGGRCNVTNAETSIPKLSKAYPRGEKKLKKAFQIFSTKDTIHWFESKGIPLVTQEDQCIFPKSQSSQTIIDCFMNEAEKKNIKIWTSTSVTKIKELNAKLHLEIKNKEEDLIFDKVIVATGGSPKRSGLDWLEQLGHQIMEPVPSLFTFNMPNEDIKKLMGIVVNPALTNIQGTKLEAEGPLLITHWGMSGPAILILSAFGARVLEEKNYDFTLQVNWVKIKNDQEVKEHLQDIVDQHPKKLISNFRPFNLPDRLWQFLIEKAKISPEKIWDELGNKGLNKLSTLLTNDNYHVKGKTTFKEEFVTCGGVSLESIDFKSMQSRAIPNLYFAGEVMDIDAITGGYNFQAAWTTAFIAGKLA